ncbi:EAL domain-containing protein [Vibrio sp. SCSIO 43136]|uniref:EAL domain-containing protein n=1 Tax=Vibrio sp. SCSIO 43136 TaxID=2819101 RepID=UPI0020764E3C|nr:EAL domain-containing protein [Vibrio sp. SCSIO 43136]USD66260.1 EAL domain-containing protein [Vibrio sp. SCSIO 43136]
MKLKGSLKARLIAITFTALLPAIGIILANTWFQFTYERGKVFEHADLVAKSLLDEQLEIITNTKHFLIALSRRQELQDTHSAQCIEAVREGVELNPYVVNIGVPDINGDLNCNATPLNRKVNVADRPYIRAAMDRRMFSIGQFQTDRAAGVTSINFAYPVYRREGGIVGAVVAVVSLNWWSERLAKADLPPQTVGLIIDANNQVIASHYGSLISNEMEVLSGSELDLSNSGTFEFTDNDGIDRLAVSRPLFVDNSYAGVRFVISMPADLAYQPVYTSLTRNIALLGLGYVLFILLLWWGFANNIIKPIFSLLKTSKSFVDRADKNVGGQLGQLNDFYVRFKHTLEYQEELKNQLEVSEIELTQTCQRLSNLLDHLPFGVIEWDKDLLITRWSPECERVFYTPESEVSGTNISQLPLLIKPQFLSFEQDLLELQSGKRSAVTCETKLCIENIVEKDLSWRLVGIYDQQQAFTGVLGMFENVTKQVEYQRELEYHAKFDTLTGLPNRYSALLEISQRIEREEACSVILFDIQDLKRINDHFGHEMGDMLLVELAERLSKRLDPDESLFRWGGNEYLLMVPLVNVEMITARIAQYRAWFAKPVVIGHRTHVTQVIVGVATSKEQFDAASDIIRCADIAVYFAKADRQITRFYEPEMTKLGSAQFELQAELNTALEKDEFFLVFQPILNSDTEVIESAEALLRWRHPDRGVVPPNEFIPVAEDTGLIVPIGEWVIEQAVKQIVVWRAMGSEIKDISVNVSTLQLNDPSLVTYISGALERHHCDPNWLTIEVTETALLAGQKEALDKIDQLRKLGIKIALDDFGTGYSSLSYLNQLPLDKLKVDRSFISQIGSDDKQVLLDAIFLIAHGLKLKVVAEGIETQAQHQYLLSRNCEYLQGYYFGKPVEKRQFDRLLSSERCTK